MTAGVRRMGGMLKREEKLTIKIEGGGPIDPSRSDSNAKGEVRGYVTHPQTHFDLNEQGKLDVRKAVGTDGLLTVVKDIGLRGLLFSGKYRLYLENWVKISLITLLLPNRCLHQWGWGPGESG